MRFLNLLLLLSATAALADDADQRGSDDARPAYESTHQSTHESTHDSTHQPIHQTVYESIYQTVDEASIGRVFLSRAERRWLDEARAKPYGGGEDQAVAGEPLQRDQSGAGFIRVPGKAPRVFRRGRFVPADVSSIAGQLAADRASGIVIVRHGDLDTQQRNDSTEAQGP